MCVCVCVCVYVCVYVCACVCMCALGTRTLCGNFVTNNRGNLGTQIMRE